MPELYVGLMSGTSLDGIDAVLADLSVSVRLTHARHEGFTPALRDTLLALNHPAHGELDHAAVAANDLARAYAGAVRALLDEVKVPAQQVTAIGCHGQTVRHKPGAGYTIQLVNAALLAELSGIAVVGDFRSRDIAAAGHGAPLAPAFHRAVFHSTQADRVIVNIGGMANVTWLGRDGTVAGFDCGPGNVLLDAWVMTMLRKTYDADGRWAASGHVLPVLAERLLSHPFFGLAPPKSTGRETFNLRWLQDALAGGEAAADVQATLLELTVRSIARAIDRYCATAREIYVCGGGARNTALVDRLKGVWRDKRVSVTDELGIDAQWVEGLAFAWLAQRTLRGEAGNVPEVTGARGPRVLGAIYPR